MDSGSSGSIQSSSGGEDEYDSRAEGFSGFLNKPPGHVGPKANPSPPLTAHHPHSSTSSALFDPFSNFLDPLSTRSHQNSIPNLDFLWPRNNPRSDPNPIHFPGSISMPPSSTPNSYMAATNSQVPHQTTEPNVVHQAPRGLTLTTDRSDVVPNNSNTATGTTTGTSNPSVRNPRKRTRASRRAPTTVLTTDTSNFRAMVQEFTGIPAPPFTPASSFPRARLDLFGGGTASTSSPPYLLRPFPQKLSTTNSLLSPSSDFLLPKQNHYLPPMSSIFNLQPSPPQPLHQPNINLLGSDQTQTDTHRNHHLHQTPLPEELLSESGNILPANWGSSGGGAGGGGVASDQALFRSMNSKYCTGTKVNNNYSASSSSLDFHGDKGSENVTTRSEVGIGNQTWMWCPKFR
ncbi:proline-rich protein 36 isoform X1 [Cucumis sativus]|uniref:proline-rich protein 36 isoform X1 n=1 Tax=Cucumis sativus TaxID=3659 RepID=UPI0012F4B983|nr:proline-rich protein 36 isoform X1 [Cucumis sativus]